MGLAKLGQDNLNFIILSLSAFVLGWTNLTCSYTQLQLLIINSTLVPGGQLENPQLR